MGSHFCHEGNHSNSFSKLYKTQTPLEKGIIGTIPPKILLMMVILSLSFSLSLSRSLPPIVFLGEGGGGWDSLEGTNTSLSVVIDMFNKIHIDYSIFFDQLIVNYLLPAGTREHPCQLRC